MLAAMPSVMPSAMPSMRQAIVQVVTRAMIPAGGLAVVLAVVLAGAMLGPTQAACAQWTAKRIAVVEGFQTPESTAVDPATGMVYVSNIVADKSLTQGSPYWAADGTGFISRLKPGGQIDQLQWFRSSPQFVLNAPKGIAISGGYVRVADLTRLLSIPLENPPGTTLRPVATPVQGAMRLNDVAADARAIYVSDTAAGKVHCFDQQGHRVLKAPPGVNGVTSFRGKLYAVSWTQHEIYLLDPAGQAEPKPLGVARHFKALDGIEVLDDGTLVVADFPGNKVCTASADGRQVDTLLQTTTPADIGLDRKRLLLYVPLFEADRVEVYQLKKQ